LISAWVCLGMLELLRFLSSKSIIPSSPWLQAPVSEYPALRLSWLTDQLEGFPWFVRIGSTEHRVDSPSDVTGHPDEICVDLGTP
jgi:hypothetical protein